MIFPSFMPCCLHQLLITCPPTQQPGFSNHFLQNRMGFERQPQAQKTSALAASKALAGIADPAETCPLLFRGCQQQGVCPACVWSVLHSAPVPASWAFCWRTVASASNILAAASGVWLQPSAPALIIFCWSLGTLP